MTTTDIAIIGMSALFPGARDLRAFWQNILDKADHVQDAPDDWTRNYLDPSSTDPERIYTRKVGLLGDLTEFNPLEFGVLPTSVDAGEPDHFLALKLARDALKDAGYLDRPFVGEKTGIILGRGSNPNRGSTTALQYGLVADQTVDLIRQLLPELDEPTLQTIRKDLKAQLPPLPPEAAPGLVSNVASGRIANRLNLMGPNYMIDAACSSSLIAVELAIKELTSGRSAMMLAGGTQSSMPPQIYMLFCRLGALARQGTIRPFDKNAMGTLLGEGVGFLVLKRLADAIQDGDRVYAVLKGVGTSSDGKALGLLAPRFEGQVLALERAYGESGVDPRTVQLVEAHGTGIPVGDQTEIRTLRHIFGDRQKPLPHCALGSVKSMIGHCIPASGVASIIKMSLSLYHKVLPPTLCDEINPNLKIEETPFYINTETRPWIHGGKTPRRAAVNAFGFGGINTHAVLEEYTGPQPSQPKQLNQHWPFELLVCTGETREGLVVNVQKVLKRLELAPVLTLANLAYTLALETPGPHRLAVVAKDLPDLHKKLTQAIEKLAGSDRAKLQGRNGVYYEEVDPNQPAPKTAFLFPGQGGQYVNMLADLCMYFPVARQWFDFLDETFAERVQLPSHYIFPPPTVLTPAERQRAADELFSMDLSSESVYTATMAMYELLKEFQVVSDVMVGHSTGENMVLEAAGVSHVHTWERRREILRGVNRIYLELEASADITKGANLSVGAVDRDFLDQILVEYTDRVFMSVDNCPNQVVLYGSELDIESIAARLKVAGGICARLPFVYPYHTPLFEKVADILHRYYSTFTEGGPPHTPVYSCATAQSYPQTRDEILAIAAGQWSSRVRFRETIENLYDQENIRVFIEVGPSGNLTAFVNDILKGRDFLALASNNQRRTGLEHIEHLLARLFVKGMTVDLGNLFRHREVQLVDLEPVAPTKPARAIPIINLLLPEMKLGEAVAQQVRDKLRPATPTAVKSVALPSFLTVTAAISTPPPE
ncbi:type I polyketide synthase, partial [Candidatus Cyanaurora vandensis]